MTDAPDSGNFAKLKYDYVVFKEGENYNVIINELCLLVSGPDLPDCISRIDREKDDLLNKLDSLGRAESIPFPERKHPLTAVNESANTLTQYMVRSLILAFVLVIGMGTFGLMVGYRLEPYFHYNYISDVTSRVTKAILEDFASEKGEDWEFAMGNLIKVKAKIQEIQTIINETPNKEPSSPQQ